MGKCPESSMLFWGGLVVEYLNYLNSNASSVQVKIGKMLTPCTLTLMTNFGGTVFPRSYRRKFSTDCGSETCLTSTYSIYLTILFNG